MCFRNGKFLLVILLMCTFLFYFDCVPHSMMGGTKEDSYSSYTWKRVNLPADLFSVSTNSTKLSHIIEMPVVGKIKKTGFILLGNQINERSAQCGLVIYSTNDLQKWEQANYPKFCNGLDSVWVAGAVCFKNKAVIIANFERKDTTQTKQSHQVLISDNGTVWNTHVLMETQLPGLYWHKPMDGIQDIAASKDCIVGVGSDGGYAAIFKSTDGVNWKKVYIESDTLQSKEDSSHIANVKWVNNSFLAFGGFLKSGPAIWTSENGDNWKVQKPFPDEKLFFEHSYLQNDGWGFITGYEQVGTHAKNERIWIRKRDGTIEAKTWKMPHYIVEGDPGSPLLIVNQDREYLKGPEVGVINVQRWLGGYTGWEKTILYPSRKELAVKPSRIFSITKDGDPVKVIIGASVSLDAAKKMDWPFARTDGAVWVWDNK